MPEFKNFSGLSKELHKRIDTAVENTAQIAGDVLHQCVNEQYYYDPEFYPNVYKRAKEFLDHAAFQMLSSNSAQIYIDIKSMHYKNNFNTWQVVKWASESKHGADYYQTNTMDFWTRLKDDILAKNEIIQKTLDELDFEFSESVKIKNTSLSLICYGMYKVLNEQKSSDKYLKYNI